MHFEILLNEILKKSSEKNKQNFLIFYHSSTVHLNIVQMHLNGIQKIFFLQLRVYFVEPKTDLNSTVFFQEVKLCHGLLQIHLTTLNFLQNVQ